MVSINWKAVQARLHVTQDGIPGVKTFGALLRQPESVAQFFADNWQRYNLTTPARLAEFIAQTGYETTDYTVWSEDLDYSAERLVQVWPDRFPDVITASPYAHNPEALGNLVYGGRMGNIESGDGYLFRGRGAIQLTGRTNYAAYAGPMRMDIVADPDLLAEPANGLLAAALVWRYRSVNFYVDTCRFQRARQVINGGLNGLAEITARRNQMLEILS